MADDLRALDRRLLSVVSAAPDKPLLASHHVYQYFGRRYGLDIISFMWKPEEIPKDAEWSELMFGLQEHPAQWMLWEGKANPGSIARLAEMGIVSLVFASCGNRPDDGGFLSVMHGNVESRAQVYR